MSPRPPDSPPPDSPPHASALLVSALPGESRAALLDARGRLLDLSIERDLEFGGGQGAEQADHTPAVGDILLGRLRKIDVGLGAAFVDIGAARSGFLALDSLAARPHEGAALVVRVVRAPSADKGAKLKPAPDFAVPAGLVPPALLAPAEDPLTALIAGLPDPAKILLENLAADPATEGRLRARLAQAGRPVTRTQGPAPLFDAELEAEIDGLMAPEVALPGGGRLWIEPVRALTAIDLDSAGRFEPGGPEALAEAINRAAVPEIARQIRLRNLSGLILIDFLELRRKTAREALLADLRAALAADPQPCQVVAMRASGLVEMTRRRARPPLHEVLSRRCGVGGGGWRPTAVTEAYRLLRRLYAAPPAPRLELRLAAEVAAALRGPVAAALAALEARRGHCVTLSTEADRGLDDSEILLQ